MNTILLVIIAGILVYIIKTLLEVNLLLLKVSKDKEIIQTPNNFDEKYQFIKGLY